MASIRSAALTFMILALQCQSARAQLPHIRLDQVFPLGGEAGSEVLLDITGKDLDDVKALHFDHPGFKVVFVKPNQFRVTIAPDTPVGSHDVRAVGTYGISGSRLFAVNSGLTEVKEKEPNDTPDKAQAVPMNSAVNGTSDGNGDDFFRFPAQKGERVTIDCRAFRLDSTLRATMVVSTADGKELARSKPYFDRTDPLLDFTAPADGDYVLGLHDMTFQGGLPYRVIISNRPQIENAFPAAVVPGEQTELTVFGRNLPGGKTSPHPHPLPQGEREQPVLTAQGRPLEQVRVPFTAPREPALLQGFQFIEHPATPSLNARGLQVWPKGLENALNPLTLVYADAPVTREREPNDTAGTAQEITLPTVVSGRFDRPGDADWYTFTAKAGEPIAVDLLCERMGMPGDPFVIVFAPPPAPAKGEKPRALGNELTNFDDHGINFNALAQFNRDPIGTFTAPANGKYHLLIQDRYGKGSGRFLYAMRIGKPEPDFYPVVVHETQPDPSCPVVRQGGSAFCELCLNRRDFNGPVTVEAEGLPKGVTCPPAHVSPQSQFVNLVFTAAADAPEWAGPVRFKAWALIDGKRVEREVRYAQRRWAIANINTSRVCRDFCLAVRPTASYAIKLSVDPMTVPAGGTLETKATVERLCPDFKGKVQLSGLNLPPGFDFATTDVPPDRKEAAIKFKVAENVPPGTYSVALRGDAQVPFNRDPKAATRPNVRVADPSTPLTVTVTAPVKK